jgi:nuclear pore complex protein Nup98-Nup96
MQAIYAIDNGDVFGAYELYASAGLYSKAHELAVLELAPDAINRKDLELLKSLFDRFTGHPVDGWHDHGKVR